MHKLAWMDVISHDIDCSLRFYENMFGWTYETLLDDNGDDYRLVKFGDVIVAGAEGVVAERNLKPTWTVMVETLDARSLIDAAVAEGAVESFVLAPMLDLGRVAMLRDPWGATLGVWEPNTFHPSKSPVTSGSLVGAVLTCPNPIAARDYHRRVFGWRDGAEASGLWAGIPVRIERGDGPSFWTPILHRPQLASPTSGVEQPPPTNESGRREILDPMGAPFLLDS